MSYFPLPSIDPFERLNAVDGLPINAERWLKVQEYHRQRQNFHYQAIHQPGIVCGLGVKIITADTKVPEAYQDGRGIQIQPGIAIDLRGNPIIVPQAQNLHIDRRPQKETSTVYVVVDYRDPQDLDVSSTQEMLQEKFRFDVKVQPPDNLEIEICRIVLAGDSEIRLTSAKNILRPSYSNLDFRYRQMATVRPQKQITVAQLRHGDPGYGENFANLGYLLKATGSLDPQLEATSGVELVAINDSQLSQYDLLYLTGRDSVVVDSKELEILQQYLATGGILLIDSVNNANSFNQSALELTKKLGYSLKPLSKTSELIRQPFLFAALPPGLNQQPLRIVSDRSIIMVYGNIASLWGRDEQLSLSREQIRSGQELGTNILHYAWKRRYFTQLSF